MTRDDFVAMVAGFARRHALPVETGTTATVGPDGRGGFAVRTPHGTVRTRSVVAATGNLNVARRPAFAAGLPASVAQIDGLDYRAPERLPPGAVLVVGCGNSGGQIAEDLALGGREVFLATGRNGRIPRRYRGRDIILWNEADRPLRTAADQPVRPSAPRLDPHDQPAVARRPRGRPARPAHRRRERHAPFRGRSRCERRPRGPRLGRDAARDRRFRRKERLGG